ncbi:MAG: UvrD-helicase domain-containing protein [Verrucomicrobia bacterium]|nr:UvrD-helicase domain-containing protein [Verrucomicrobiota bacterium]
MFTEEQRRAIAANGNVLVAAGAGTGKTRTLVERCVRLVEEGHPVRGLLLVTFTEAAAAEMKARLRTALQAKAAAETTPGYLHEQLALLDGACIGTLHGFCLQLMRDHFYDLAIDPQVIVLDEAQTLPMIREALDVLLDPWLERSSPTDAQSPWALLLVQFGSDAVAELREVIVKIHRYAQALPNPIAWYESQLRSFASEDPALWRARLVAGVCEWAREWLPRLERTERCPPVATSLGALQLLTKDGLVWDLIDQALQQLSVADALAWPKGRKTTVRRPLEPFFRDVEFLGSLCGQASDGSPLWESDWRAVRPAMSLLVSLARDFGAEYERAKREWGGVDFSDLEQKCLRLLIGEDGEPTSIALRCRERFSHVFVDEVQDINAAQDAIIRAVSREGTDANRFLVGDAKQSIYRFRLANPAVFRRYQEAWARETIPAPGQVIALRENFRSREAILSAANALFGFLMQPDLGGIAYDEQARLRFGSAALRAELGAEPRLPCVELRVLLPVDPLDSTDQGAPAPEGEPDGEAVDVEGVEREARWTAGRLRRMRLDPQAVWEEQTGAFRPARWSDMVILLRAPGSKVEAFAKEFHRAGIPLIAERGGFFASQEVQDLLSLLGILDNPLQDIPLLAVLRSPLVGFTLGQLSEVRAVERKAPFWMALMALAQRPPAKLDPEASDTAKRCVQFLRQHARWREAMRFSPLSACLESILAETQYEILLRAQSRGEERLANVRRLLDLARQFDPYQRQGLFRFLRFIEAQEESDPNQENGAAAAMDAVRLLSVHKSKGLEYPIVVVADLARKWNARDLTQEILIDEELGLSPRVVDPVSGLRFPSPAQWLARRRGRRESLGEEIRLLYVAFTRAKDRLILVGSAKPKGWQPEDEEADPSAVEAHDPLRADVVDIDRAKSTLDWLAMWWRRERQGLLSGDAMIGASRNLRWHVSAVDAEEQAASPGGDEDPREARSVGEAALPEFEEVLARLSWTYPHASAAREPAKTTVSALRRRGRDLDSDAAESAWVSRSDARPRPSTQRASSGAMSAAERGTAHHAFLQWLNLGRAESALDLRNEAHRLVAAGVLTEEEEEALDFRGLEAFWSSELGRAIRDRREKVHREASFTARVSVGDLRRIGALGIDSDLADDEFVVVQGQMDLIVILDEELWLVDFKTDSVKDEEVAARAGDYRTQIAVYAHALQAIYHRPVTRRVLYFLAARQAMEQGAQSEFNPEARGRGAGGE